MRTTTRTLSAALLTLPLVAGAAAPALAAPPMRYSESGDHVEAGGLLLGEIPGFEGNVHFVGMFTDATQGGSYGYGYLDSWSCDDGVTVPYDPETGEELCDFAGFSDLESMDANLTVGKKLVNGGLSGTFTSVTWECDEETGECQLVEGPSLYVDVDITSASTKAATYRSTESFRDPATGYSYRGTMTQKYTQGEATGTVGGQELVDGYGLVGTFTFTAMEKL